MVGLKEHDGGQYAGKHVLLDVRGITVTDTASIRRALLDGAHASNATILFDHFHEFQSPDGVTGVTGVVLLAESHITIHTWPEFQYAAVDIFMCGDCEPELAVDVICKGLADGDVTKIVSTYHRGHIND